MQIKPATGESLSPHAYARLTGRSLTTMPTVLGKVAGKCTEAELEKLEAWHAAAAKLFMRLEEYTRNADDYTPGTSEQALIRQHQDLQRTLWRWALGLRG
jgi:hypothetical protein